MDFMALRPEYLTFDKILSNRLFSIPSYQRAYSWKEKQRKELFNDILKLYQGKDCNRHHFMATIVCLDKNEKQMVGTDELVRVDVVDGQQRLTTLIILLKALAKKLVEKTDDEKEEAKKLQELLVKKDERLILLQTNHDSAKLFTNYLITGKIPAENQIKTAAEKNLVNAFNECEKFINEHWCLLNNDDLLGLLILIRHRLDFIFYTLQDEGAVYTVFEVLNSRGLEVDWLDKCKSMLMGVAFEKFTENVAKEKIKTLHRCWSNIYATIGKRSVSGQEILSISATLRDVLPNSKLLSAEKALEFFRDEALKRPESVVDISHWIEEVTQKFVECSEEIRLKAITDISQARLLYISINLSNLLPEVKTQILSYWEKITFRIFGIYRKDSRTMVGDYVRLACKIINGAGEEEILKDFIGISKKHPAVNIEFELANKDCYNNWTEEVRYFLYRYEEYLVGQKGGFLEKDIWNKIWVDSPSKTIEHIHPQKFGRDWEGKIGKNQEEVADHVHRVGNLLLLPSSLNSKAATQAFAAKKVIYGENHLRMMDTVMREDQWTLKEIEKREKEMVEFALKTWGDL